jgi:signal transduction histidine kinase
LRLSEAFLAEGQRLARLGNFSWLVAEGEIECSVEFLRVYGIEQGTPLTLEQFVERGHPEDRPLVQHTLDRARRGEADLEYEHRLLLPDGSIKHVHMVAHRSDDASGRLRYIGAVQDVTQRRLADAALDRARADLEHVSRAAAMNALTASIAHEINQPLSGIVTNAGTCLRMLDAVPPNVEGARETARRTIRDGLRASEMIARLKALFSRGELAMEPFDLNDAAREVVVLMLADLQDNHIVLKPEFGNDLPPVAGDRLQVQQVILNLLRNAMDAMIGIDDRPRLLTIRTEREPGDRVRLTVRDAGPGVDAQAMDKLFRAFHSTKPGGMGIGLSVSRSIIERHQGRIWAEPNVGPGATFAFSIPLRPDQA